MPICNICRELMHKWAQAEQELFAAESILVETKYENASQIERCQAILSMNRLEYETRGLEFQQHRSLHTS